MIYLTYWSFSALVQRFWIPVSAHGFGGRGDQYNEAAQLHALEKLQSDIFMREKEDRQTSGFCGCCTWLFEPVSNSALQGAGLSKMPIATVAGLAIVCLFWSIALYYLMNLVDWSLCVILNSFLYTSDPVVQCIKLFPWMYADPFRSIYEHDATGTNIDEFRYKYRMNSLSWAERGGFVLPLPTWFTVGVDAEINIPICHWRLVPLMAITWICTFFLFTRWRFSQRLEVKRAKHQERSLRIEHAAMGGLIGGGGAGGGGGMFTQVLQFFGGNR